MNPTKMLLPLTLAAAMVFPTAGALFHHTSTAPHRSFARRHPVLTTVAGVAVVHHLLKHRR